MVRAVRQYRYHPSTYPILRLPAKMQGIFWRRLTPAKDEVADKRYEKACLRRVYPTALLLLVILRDNDSRKRDAYHPAVDRPSFTRH
jgi:hypothetical protein